VHPPALYHYWPSRTHLLREASALGWERFRAGQSASVTGADDPIVRLEQRGRAYLEFSLAEPALFRVLFLLPGSMDPSAAPAAEGQAMTELTADVAAAMRAGVLLPQDPLTTALVLWSAVHGIASLWAATPGMPADLARSVAHASQRAVLTGLATPTE